jgi:hypothetical protein
MIRLYPKQTTKFIKFSGDNNKIHYDKNYSENFFFKKPIQHGMNLVLSAFEEFFKLRNYDLILDDLKIDFKNFCLLDEKVYMKYNNKRILVFGDINDKIENNFKLIKKKKNKLIKKSILNNL